MANSLKALLRARLEKLQKELKPVAGFDRRAYGYEEEDGGGDATFEEVDREGESPWRRPGDHPARASPDPSPAPAGEGGGRRPETARRGPPRASIAAAARERRSARLRGGQGAPTPGDAPFSPHPDAPAPAAAPGGSQTRPPRAQQEERARGRGRMRRLRARLQGPESLRELFVLREVLDRPVVLRGRPRGRRPS